MDAAQPLPDPPTQVLYVGDGSTPRSLLRALFRLRPHLELHVANDGAEATAIARSLRPALLIVDTLLSDCLGSELLPLMRLRFGWRGVPAVAVTAEPRFELNPHSFVEVWQKPLDLPWVLQRLDDWLPDSTSLSLLPDPLPQSRPLLTRHLH